jgi:hypothetical protein
MIKKGLGFRPALFFMLSLVSLSWRYAMRSGAIAASYF